MVGRTTSESFNACGVSGYSNYGYGVRGRSFEQGGIGVSGVSDKGGIGVSGRSRFGGRGVSGSSTSGIGVRGFSDRGVGVLGRSEIGVGVRARSDTADAVDGQSGGRGVAGVIGINTNMEQSGGYGVIAASHGGTALYCVSPSLAAYLYGNVRITGNLTVDGISKSGGQFKIDHPLDPANKYLCHSFVESPDMKNVYDGVVTLDDKGEAEIELPDWFDALNKDFRYQLTAIGAPGPNLYIAEEISEATTSNYSESSSNNNNNSRFKIAGGSSGMKVSWQVTGIRKDPWANANRIQVEEEKPANERGYYTYPDLYGQPEDKGISNLLFPKDKRIEEVLARAAHK